MERRRGWLGAGVAQFCWLFMVASNSAKGLKLVAERKSREEESRRGEEERRELKSGIS